MVEASVSGTAVFTEVKDRQLKPFNLKDAAGNSVSGVIPLNSRPVLGAGGFQVSARQPFHFAADRFSIAPEASYGLAWGSDYSTMYWSVTADTALNFLNGNARISSKLGYGGYKVESHSTFPETRHGFKLGLEGAVRLATDLNFVSQASVTLTADGPQTLVTFGAQWLFNRRPEPPVELDDSLGRQSMAAAEQLLHHMDRTFHIPNAMAEVGVNTSVALNDRLMTLSAIVVAFSKGEKYASLPSVDDELAKVQTSLDNAANNGIRSNTLSSLRKSVRNFKEIRYTEALQLTLGMLADIERQQSHKAAEQAAAGNHETATEALEACIENLTVTRALLTTLESLLPPAGKVDAATALRKATCLLKAEGCTSDMDPEMTVPAIQKRIKSTGADAEKPKEAPKSKKDSSPTW